MQGFGKNELKKKITHLENTRENITFPWQWGKKMNTQPNPHSQSPCLGLVNFYGYTEAIAKKALILLIRKFSKSNPTSYSLYLFGFYLSIEVYKQTKELPQQRFVSCLS